MSWLQKIVTRCANDQLLIHFYKLIAAMTHGSFKATIDTFDTQENSKRFSFAEGTNVETSGSKSAEKL